MFHALNNGFSYSNTYMLQSIMIRSKPIRPISAKIFRLIKARGFLPRCASIIFNLLPFNILDVLLHACPVPKEIVLMTKWILKYVSGTVYQTLFSKSI